jgi:hypothetical protein
MANPSSTEYTFLKDHSVFEGAGKVVRYKKADRVKLKSDIAKKLLEKGFIQESTSKKAKAKVVDAVELVPAPALVKAPQKGVTNG